MTCSNFKILLEDELYYLAEKYFYYEDLVNGDCSFTKWGKNRDKEKYYPKYVEVANKLCEEINRVYPQFVCEFVIRRTIGNRTNFYFLEVIRIINETK